MLTSAQIRQSFLDFFREKKHTIVPSSSLMPDSPNLLFTNAGMNQFVPIFLGERKPDVSKWAGAIPASDTRAADTQKCIRAGGKHNDLDDVGLDTYHHTFFEMLGNWSFGDYFKKEAIEWAWELVVERWKFPAQRVYATIYQPDPGDPAERDQEAWDFWAEKFRAAGLDPAIHIVNGNKKDNFWMMGETGPCGPCSELHIDLTPAGDTRGLLVNQGTAECIEIWNLVFIQFNAQMGSAGASPAVSGAPPETSATGGVPNVTSTAPGAVSSAGAPKTAGEAPALPISFVPLPACHVDTGMGFERVASIIQGTKGFTDFAHAHISNYETDIFRPLFDELERMSGKTYRSTLPGGQKETVGSAGPSTEKSAAKVASDDHISAGNRLLTGGNEPVTAGEQPLTAGNAPFTAGEEPVTGGDEQLTGGNPPVTGGDAPLTSGNAPFTGGNEATAGQTAIDVAFRVIADHIRTLSFAIADGIQPGNTDRHYVLRRILRRAVRYGRTLGFREPFFHRLVPVLAREFGEVFPELRARQKHIEEVLKREEEAFNKTLDRGIELFEREVARLTTARSAMGSAGAPPAVSGAPPETSASGDVARDADTARGPVSSAGAPKTAGEAPALPKTAETHGVDPARATYYRRRLPHFERPWAKYMITFSTKARRVLSPAERDIVMETILHDHGKKYELYAACVMLDHVHLLIEPAVKQREPDGKTTFFALSEILQTLKSVSSHRINKAVQSKGQQTWENESFDRMIRSDADLEEKFLYIINNPRGENLVGPEEEYAWVWTPDQPVRSGRETGSAGAPPAVSGASPETSATGDVAGGAGAAHGAVSSAGAPKTAGGAPALPSAATPSEISGAFAFRLYDEQGFPLDLTELMARERGLTVDTAGFEVEMEKQRARARAAQKKQVIELSEVETKEPTKFLGYDQLATPAKVLEVVALKDKTAVILDATTAYAEMGGQVGDTAELTHGADVWHVTNTQKSGATWLHFLGSAGAPPAVSGAPAGNTERADALPITEFLPLPGDAVVLNVDRDRRRAIERHHSVTHLLHWALHEVVSREATQKGSFVGPDKLTFDFNHQPLTPPQVRDVERLVNERIVENAAVSWSEVPYAAVKGRADIVQFFGDKYGETVRVVDIGGYSKELCAGTHTRATGEIGLFRINSEAAIAAGVRRIEAVAGLNAYDFATLDTQRLHALAARIGTPLPELEKRIEGMLAQQKELEKALKAAGQREAASRAKELLAKAETINGIPAIIANLGTADGDTLQTVADALKSHGFRGVVVVAGVTDPGHSVALVAAVSPDFTAKVQAGKIIAAIAPLVGGKGGGKPEAARGGGKDPSQLDAALAKARELLG